MVLFTWIHLTDLHLGMKRFNDLWPNIRERLFDDIGHVIKQTGPVDLILFTGDFVDKGKVNEYGYLESALTELWDHLDFLESNPKLAAVPGNHDLVWPNATDPAVINLLNLWNDSELEVQDLFWDDGSSAYRHIVKEAFANYEEWFDKTKLPKIHAPANGLLPGDFSASLEKDGVKLGILGVNSAFLQLADGIKKESMAIDVRQFHAACNGDGPKWIKQHDLCILLSHHPPEWMTEEARAQLSGEIHYPPERFVLHIFGHMHEGNLSSQGQGGHNVRRRLQGPSLFGLEHWGEENIERIHGYSFGQLKIDGEVAYFQSWPRIALPRPHEGLELDRDLMNYTLPKGEESIAPIPVKLLRKSMQSPKNGAPPSGNFDIQPMADIRSMADIHLDIKPENKMGSNIFHIDKRGSIGGVDGFFVKVNFDFWLKQAIEIINIDLSYAMQEAFPGQQKISFDNTGYELMNSSFRMKNRRMISAGSVANIFISRRFTCRYGQADLADYRRVTINIDFVEDKGSAMRTLKIIGKLEPGGRLDVLSADVLSMTSL